MLVMIYHALHSAKRITDNFFCFAGWVGQHRQHIGTTMMIKATVYISNERCRRFFMRYLWLTLATLSKDFSSRNPTKATLRNAVYSTGCQNHCHLPSFHGWQLFRLGFFLQFFLDPHQNRQADILMGHSRPRNQSDLHLIPKINEFMNTLADPIIMCINIGQFDFLTSMVFCFLSFSFAFLFFVFKFAVIIILQTGGLALGASTKSKPTVAAFSSASRVPQHRIFTFFIDKTHIFVGYIFIDRAVFGRR